MQIPSISLHLRLAEAGNINRSPHVTLISYIWKKWAFPVDELEMCFNPHKGNVKKLGSVF